jgi:hypothetical protein
VAAYPFKIPPGKKNSTRAILIKIPYAARIADRIKLS